MTNQKLVNKFTERLDEATGDMFFSSGDIDQDAELIRSTLNSQGYWAATGYKLYFNEEMDLIKVEERSFGA